MNHYPLKYVLFSAFLLATSLLSYASDALAKGTETIDIGQTQWVLTSAGTVTLNGKLAGYTKSVITIVNVGGTLYQKNAWNHWWAWNGSGWTATNGPSATITDREGNIWSLTAGEEIYKNGSPAGYSSQVIQLIEATGRIYQENLAGGWWYWNGEGWTASSPPSASPTPAPSPESTPMPTPKPTTSSTPSPTPTESSMSAPPGYSRLIFDDKFGGTTLDMTKWYPQIGDQNTFPWNDYGKLPYPLSAVGNDGHYDAEYDDPTQITVSNGLTITAVRDNRFSFYSWKSGVIDTHDKFRFTGGYLQVRAKMPDSATGGWGAIWSLEGGCEIDTQETGFTDLGSALTNQEVTSHMPGCNGGQFINSGVDLSAGYHIYGMEYIPGKSVTTYVDGKRIAQWTASIPSGGMSIILSLEIAQNTNGWHTVASSQTPDALTMKVSEVQVWQ